MPLLASPLVVDPLHPTIPLLSHQVQVCTHFLNLTLTTDPSSSPTLSVDAASQSPATDVPVVATTVVKAVKTQTTLVTQTRAASASTSTPVVDNGSSGSGGNASSGSGQAGGSCSPDGAIVCASDGLHFFMCNNGALVDMGSVAAGTTCSDGKITRKRGLPPHLHRRLGHSGRRLF